MLTEPWYPCEPFWATLPDSIARELKDDYEHRAALMEYDGGMLLELAEQAAYSFMFADRPEVISPFVDDSEIERQLLRARIIKKIPSWERKIEKNRGRRAEKR